MARAKFTQAEIDRISKAAAKSGVPIVAEFVAPDGSKIIIIAGNNGTRGESDSSDLDQWIRDRDARASERHKQ